ncbi:hypothetical protein D3C76_1463490 [compost metagenome]
MFSHRCRCLYRVAVEKCRHDRIVLLDRFFGNARMEPEAEQVHMGVKPAECFLGHLVVATFRNPSVELSIELGELPVG